MKAFWIGAVGASAAILLMLFAFTAWFTYNRALDGEKAWVCLQRPQPGCGIAAPPPTSPPAPPAK